MDTVDQEVGEEGHSDGTVEVVEVPDVERAWAIKLGDLGGGVGGLSSSSGSSKRLLSISSNDEIEAEVIWASCTEPEAPIGKGVSFVWGASNGGIPPSSALSPSPSRYIRESLIMLSVGRRRCLRRATGEVGYSLVYVGDGGAVDTNPWSSHGSSGNWAPGRPLRTYETSRPSASSSSGIRCASGTDPKMQRDYIPWER